MADELTVTALLNFVKGSTVAALTSPPAVLTVSGDNYISGTQTIGTSEEQLNFGDVATPGYLLVFNLDPTNYVEIGAVTGQYGVRCRAGEPALFRVNGAGVFCKANTGPCPLGYLLIED